MNAQCSGDADAPLVNSPDAIAVNVAALLRQAIEQTGCAHKYAAAATGYQADYWNRVLSDERGITLNRLGRIPLAAQRQFVAQWGAAIGLAPVPGIEELKQLGELLASRRVRIVMESK